VKKVIEASKKNADISLLVDKIPYAKFLGISVREEERGLLGVLHFSEGIIGNTKIPAIHGGTIGTLLESTAIFTLLWSAESVVIPKTVNITIEYLRTGKPVDTFARAVTTRHGRRVANVRSWAWQEDEEKPIAAATAHFLLQ